jgi:hypothetical protein
LNDRPAVEKLWAAELSSRLENEVALRQHVDALAAR